MDRVTKLQEDTILESKIQRQTNCEKAGEIY